MKIKPPLAKIEDPGILAMKDDKEGIPVVFILAIVAAVIIFLIYMHGKEKSS